MKANVEIYTWSHCPYSKKAKMLLQIKEISYQEYCIDGDEAARNDMIQRANGSKTLPQIFINNEHIGGCDDLHVLEDRGNLDQLLQGKSLHKTVMKTRESFELIEQDFFTV